jgi:hypothetical protein
MKINYKRILLYTLFSLSTVFVFSQDSPVQFGGDFMSRYIWRGLNLGGNSPSIQPTLKLNLATENKVSAFTVGAWGAFSLSQLTAQEADLFVTYTFKQMIGLTVTDYFFPTDVTTARNHYFDYNPSTTGHLLEGAISFNGTEKVPVTFMFAVNFYGNDKRKLTADSTAGNLVYSKYMEIGYFRTIPGGVDLKGFIGAALDNPDKIYGGMGYYLNRSAGIVNVGVTASKKIPITDKFVLPVQSSLIFNPEAQNIFIVFGFTL